MSLKHRACFLFAFFLTLACTALRAQPGFSVDIKKEKPYEERKLKAEKTGEGKIKAPKRIFQNLTTHFNYVFNANNKFHEIIERAKAQHRDDYAQLLTFYPYALEATAADSAQLDSVIYKCRTGIVNHDLREEWADELYLLWAASWHLQKKLDSASMMLQFINYAYAPQQEYGYYDYIGSRKDGAQEISIVTPEKKQFLHSNTFGRNNAFIWQVRTLTELESFASAGSLITTLKRDPAFPKRLVNDLQEAEAYWYYKQGRWDSAARYLTLSLDGADSKKERARREYLAAQLFDRSGNPSAALDLYNRAIATTNDPVLEVYARLNLVRLSKEGGEGAVDKNVAELLKMARRDKYEEYRDIIYFMAAQMEMERGNVAAAQELLLKGSKYNNGNTASRNKAFLQIADVSYGQKKYLQAAAFYDSVQVAELSAADVQRIEARRAALKPVVEAQALLNRQDSLQRIAALPAAEREDYLKKLAKRLRKEQGLKDEAAPTGGNAFAAAAGTPPATDLFSGQKGEWYFYNTTARTQGATEFRQSWGNRPNVDNWRRFAVVSQQVFNQGGRSSVTDPTISAGTDAAELSAEGLAAKLPLTAEALKVSNDSIRTALFNLGIAYLNEIEDYPSAIAAFEELRKRFPSAAGTDEVLFNLYYAHTRAGNTAEAARIKQLLLQQYPASRYAAILTTGKDPLAKADNSAEATKAYEGVYNLFIEGAFDRALAAKQAADSTYKTTTWQPQLLYIEAVYHVRQRDDSAAVNALQTIVRQNNHPALTEKAQTLMNVLARRQQIEDELNRYQIQNAPDAVAKTPVATPPTPPPAKDTATKQAVAAKTDAPADKKPAVDKAADSTAKAMAAAAKARAAAAKDSLAKQAAAAKKESDRLAAAAKKERDSIAAARALALKAAKDSAAKRALAIQAEREALARTSKAAKDSLAKVIKAERDSIAKATAAAKRAADSLARAEAAAKRTQDSAARKAAALAAQNARDSIAREQARAKQVSDSLARIAALRQSPQGYAYVPETPHAALVILDKVDPVFVNEARNAFFRFNREKFSALPLDVQIVNLSADQRLLYITGFANATAAADYAVRAKGLAPTEIIPWLTGNKYTFSIISGPNLDVLKEKGDLPAYKKFLGENLPVKF